MKISDYGWTIRDEGFFLKSLPLTNSNLQKIMQLSPAGAQIHQHGIYLGSLFWNSKKDRWECRIGRYFPAQINLIEDELTVANLKKHLRDPRTT